MFPTMEQCFQFNFQSSTLKKHHNRLTDEPLYFTKAMINLNKTGIQLLIK